MSVLAGSDPAARWRLPDMFAVAAAALVGVLVVGTFAVLGDLVVWGHDEVHYWGGFAQKLVEDGRWINYLLRDVLRAQPPATWALAWFVGWTAFFYRAARELGLPRPESWMLAGIVLMTFPYVEQLLWPATAFPGLLALLALQLAARRGLPVPAICLIGGVALFGAIQSYYFLLPLLFLAPLFDASAGVGQRWRRFVGCMGWWVAGAAVGVLSMSIAVWLLVGQFGVEPASWRQVQRIEQAADVLRNLRHVEGWFEVFARTLRASLGLDQLALLVLLAAIGLPRIRRLPAALPGIALLAAVALGFFAMSVPLAPVIHGRSLVAMSAAVVVAVMLVAGRGDAARVAGCVVALALAWHASLVANRVLQEHHVDTRYIARKLEAVLPAKPAAYSRVEVHGLLPAGEASAAFFNEPSRLLAITIAAGARGYRDCRMPGQPVCEDHARLEATQTIGFGSGELWFAPGPEGSAVVGWRPLGRVPQAE